MTVRNWTILALVPLAALYDVGGFSLHWWQIHSGVREQIAWQLCGLFAFLWATKPAELPSERDGGGS